MILGTWIDFPTLAYSSLYVALLTFSAPLDFSFHTLDQLCLASQAKAYNCGFLQKMMVVDCLGHLRGLSVSATAVDHLSCF